MERQARNIPDIDSDREQPREAAGILPKPIPANQFPQYHYIAGISPNNHLLGFQLPPFPHKGDISSNNLPATDIRLLHLRIQDKSF